MSSVQRFKGRPGAPRLAGACSSATCDRLPSALPTAFCSSAVLLSFCERTRVWKPSVTFLP
eukprot:9182190-Pyramimonas_sp.AAC.1